MSPLEELIKKNIRSSESFVENYNEEIYTTFQDAINNKEETIESLSSLIHHIKLEKKIDKIKLKLSKHNYDSKLMDLLDNITIYKTELERADYHLTTKRTCVINNNEIWTFYDGDKVGYGDYLFSINNHKITTDEFSKKQLAKIKKYCSEKFKYENEEVLFKFLIHILEGDAYLYEKFQKLSKKY